MLMLMITAVFFSDAQMNLRAEDEQHEATHSVLVFNYQVVRMRQSEENAAE